MKYALVPVEATDEMIAPLEDFQGVDTWEDAFSAMLAASPNGGKLSLEALQAGIAVLDENIRHGKIITMDVLARDFVAALGLEVEE